MAKLKMRTQISQQPTQSLRIRRIIKVAGFASAFLVTILALFLNLSGREQARAAEKTVLKVELYEKIVTSPEKGSLFSGETEQKRHHFLSNNVLHHLSSRSEPTGIRVQWIISLENPLDQFIVERSADGVNFKRVYIMASGQIGGIGEFQFLDSSPNQGENYYRLSVETMDGEWLYSWMVCSDATI